jgi:hypothetical protein
VGAAARDTGLTGRSGGEEGGGGTE